MTILRRRENSKVGGVPYYHSMGSIPNATEGEHVLAVCHSGPVKVAGKAIRWQSMEWMRLSKFCLHPAGDTPSSCRLFDAVVTNCVLVIVSDQIELPYEDKLDYTQFSVFFSVKEALELRQFPKDRSLEMWRQLKSIPNHFEFQYPPKKEDAVNMIWRHVKHKVPAAKLAVHLAVHRSRRLKVPDWCTKGDSRAAFLFRYYTPLSFIGKTFTIE